MSNMSQYQRKFWFSKVAELQHGEFCKGCGFSKHSNWTNREFTGLIIDKINNDGNHNICDNEPEDFQLLCKSCNAIKNPPQKRGQVLDMTQSEQTNKRAEKPLMDWLFQKLEKGDTVTWPYFVSEGSYKFDISPETIERRYFKKYFEAPSAPFDLIHDIELKKDVIILKKKDKPKTVLDITPVVLDDPPTPTPSIPD